MLQSPSWTLSAWQSHGGQTDWWRSARPPVTFSTRNSRLKNPGPAGPQAPEYPTRATWRSPSTQPKHEPTPGSMTELPRLQWHRWEVIERHFVAILENLYIPLVSAKVLPLPTNEEEAALKDDDAEEEDHKDVPQEEPEDHLDLSLLEKRPWKVQLFALLLRLSWATALRIASLWRTLRRPLHRCLQDISWEEVGESKPSIVEVHEGLEGDRVLHLCHHCIMLLKDDISPKGTRVVLATSQSETADETGITGGLESQGLHGESPPVRPGGGLDKWTHGWIHVLNLGKGPNDIGPVQDVKGL